MPLFTSFRDAGFLKSINRELIHSFISNEVGVYKLDLNSTQTNIYGESSEKSYHPQVRLFALIRQDPKESVGDDYGLSFSKIISVGFIKSDLIDAGIFLTEGDIVHYDNGYYEVSTVQTTNYWGGKNPNTLIGITEDNWELNGYDHSIVAECRLTTEPNLHINDVRIGHKYTISKQSINKKI